MGFRVMVTELDRQLVPIVRYDDGREVEVEDLVNRLNRLETTIAALVKAWPTDDSPDNWPADEPGYCGPCVILDCQTKRWTVAGAEGEYPTREAAVFAAAGIKPEDQP